MDIRIEHEGKKTLTCGNDDFSQDLPNRDIVSEQMVREDVISARSEQTPQKANLEYKYQSISGVFSRIFPRSYWESSSLVITLDIGRSVYCKSNLLSSP
jgi:hypothetical protein